MLNIATSLGRSGFQDWFLQRVSALILALYIGFLLWFWIGYPEHTHHAWKQLFSIQLMRYSTLLALLALLCHAWIGIWTITTDYLKIVWLRLTVQIIVYIMLLFYLVWGIQILWGN
jgi:succinate dehydrogenase / fumarate reductase membrane anchor subunit